MGQGVRLVGQRGFSHLDTAEQYAALLCRVCALPANEDNAKWTRGGTDALCFKDIEERVKISDSDLHVFSFGHAYGRGTQRPDTCIMFCDRFLERRRIGQEVVKLDCGKLWVRRRGVIGRGTTGENDPWREGATAEVSDVANTIVDEKGAKDSQAGCHKYIGELFKARVIVRD